MSVCRNRQVCKYDLPTGVLVSLVAQLIVEETEAERKELGNAVAV
jgi:hypothetical protein